MQYKAEFYDIKDRLHEVEGLELSDMEVHIKSVLKATGSFDDIILVELKPNEFGIYCKLAGFIVAEPVGFMWAVE